LGGIPPRLLRANPRRVKPKGASSGRRSKPTFDRQGFPKGSIPRNRSLRVRPSAPVAGSPVEGTVSGSIRTVMAGCLFGRRKLRRVNPKSAAGAKQNRHGSKGASRQEGRQTLKTDRSGQAKPAGSGPSTPQVLKGSKVHERGWRAAARWLGVAESYSGGRRNSKRGFGWKLNRNRPIPAEEKPHSRGKRSNGTVGPPNPYGGISADQELWTSSQFREDAHGW